MVSLKSASFIVIILLHEGLTRGHSQKKKKKQPRLHFGESFTLNQWETIEFCLPGLSLSSELQQDPLVKTQPAPVSLKLFLCPVTMIE